MRGIARGWVVLAAVLAACDDGVGPRVPELRVPDAVLAARGDTIRLEVRGEGALENVRWQSLNPAVVTVTEDGLATAVTGGNARVRASLEGAEAEGTVRVLPPVEIRVSEVALVTDPGGKPGVRMRIRNVGGRGFYTMELWKLEPDGTKRRLISHGTETPAEPGLDIEYVGYLSAEAPDWVVMYSREPLAPEPVRTACVALDGAPGCPGDLPDPPAVHSVSVSPAAAVLAVGDSVLYEARAYDANGAEILGRAVTWHTPSPGVVRLDERGMATALAKGYGQVEATVGGVQGSVALTVTDPAAAVDSVWVGPASLTVAVGDTVRYTARAFDASGLELTGLEVRWSTSTPLVLSVGGSGLVTALAVGQGVVVATVEGVSANTGIRVESPSGVTRLEVHSVGILFTGETFRFRALALDERGVPVDGIGIVWTSSNPDVVEARADGTMVGRGAGWAVVQAAGGGLRERITVRVTAEPGDGLVLTAIPQLGDPQLHVVTLGPAGSTRLVQQGPGLRNPVASPDGSRFAFVLQTQDGGSDLFLVNADGTGLRRLTTNAGLDNQPAWSPDGRSLAFRSVVGGLPDIWVVEADGSGLRNLTALGDLRPGSLGVERPAWSPDGAWVAYAWGDRTLGAARMSLRMIRRDGSETRVVTAYGSYEDTEPSFSPRGDRIVFRRSGNGAENRILVVDLYGNVVDPGADLGTGRTPRWSPDGNWVVYVRPTTGASASGALVLRRIGWDEERALGWVTDGGWAPVR